MRYTFPVLILIPFAALLGCNGNDHAAGSSGFIEADAAIISAEVSGRVERRLVSEGAAVHVGDTLLVIDKTKLDLQLSALSAARQVTEATLATARLAVEKARKTEEFATSERDRVGRLITSGSATQKQFDQVQYEASQAIIARRSAEANVTATAAQLEKTDADIALLNRLIQDCAPLSPIDGIVTETYVDPGEFVNPGKAMMKIARLDTVWVKIYLPAEEYATVKLGDAASVSTETDDAVYPGTVIWTSAEAEFVPKNVQTKESRSDLVYAVKVAIPNAQNALKIGQPVFATIKSK
jgi:HlyD family secretion protein